MLDTLVLHVVIVWHVVQLSHWTGTVPETVSFDSALSLTQKT